MKVYFAGDHAGFELKEKLLEFVRALGHEIVDLGPTAYNAEDDYPDFVIPMAKRVAENAPTTPHSPPQAVGAVRGIIVAGSGQGEVRAAEYYGGNLEVVRKSREHNDANVLSIGARFVTETEAKEAVTLFLETPFSNDERHVRRLAKIEKLTS